MGMMKSSSYKKVSTPSRPRGCVPMLVGSVDDKEEKEMILVQIRLLKHPIIRLMLEMSEKEFGYDQKGIINIPCDLAYFKRLLNSL
ncbi:hypothetical protein ZOSMA_452G00070 [Zostera marina]|uniref:SAUR-like auxin-responsive protein family n=1 Tax=Zostera marina TaxID=29655 RepID=A0A0K9P2V6_ZOSMR|nr:hypothetical protein ZOSMA_452G00070 [Zostera marina]